jgi:signal peptidase I
MAPPPGAPPPSLLPEKPLAMTESRRKSQFYEFFKTILYALIIAGVVRTFLFEPFNIPSGSMLQNLLIGDYLFVSKYTYGYSTHSLPFGLNLFSGRIFGSLPERGDVVVFKYPGDNKTDYIKRVIGLPGDTLQVRDGRLYLNGTLVPRQAAGVFDSDECSYPPQRYQVYSETLPNGFQHSILEVDDQSAGDNTRIFTVPARAVFMLGDNRDNSTDSRFNVGFVPLQNIVGKGQLIFFSIDCRHLPVWRFYDRIRWSRLFSRIAAP